MLDEYLDLVNSQDQIIDKKLRSLVYAERLSNFRTVNAFLINSQGELWIPKRSIHKKLFPGGYDMSMGGHVESGESYDEAFKRELSEELNMNLEAFSWKCLGHLTPQDHVSSFMNIYEILTDKTPQFNCNDFSDSFWILPAALMRLIELNKNSKSDLAILIQKFYL